MKIIIYRNKEDNSIARFETIDKYIECGHTIEEIEEKVNTYDNTSYNVYVQDIPDDVSEIVQSCAVDSTMLFTDKLLHSCDEEVPNNTYIYAFYKHKGHDIPSVNIMKVFSQGVRLPELHDKEGNLPIAWCKASEICDMLGFSRRNVNKLTSIAKSLAWAWYKD